MQAYGDQPRPWILAIGFSDSHPVGMAIRDGGFTVKYVDGSRDVAAQVRQVDYDCAIIVGEAPELEGHLRVLHFGGTGSSDRYDGHGPYSFSYYIMAFPDKGLAARFELPSGLAPHIAEQTRNSLIPHLLASRPHALLLRAHHAKNPMSSSEGVEPFVSEADGGYPCAGRWLRPTGGADWWWLPEDVPDPGKWLAVALAEWSDQDPVRFPSGPDWLHDATWSTRAESRLQEQITELDAEFLRRRTEYETARLQLVEQLHQARLQADAADRRLLTAKGPELVQEVMAALSAFGFTVVNADEALRAGGASKQEDLQISDERWTAVAEVKGYDRRDAKAGDLLQVNKAVEVFILRNGRQPDARWYIVNQSASVDAKQRRRPLAGATDELQIFGSTGGLVVDTRDLFRLRQAADSGNLSPDVARNILTSSTGLFSYPSDDKPT